MKTKRAGRLLLLLSCAIGLAGCTHDDDVVVMNAQISPYTCIGSTVPSSYPIESMLIKFDKSSSYESMGFNNIEGFVYDRGYEYEVEVERTTLKDPVPDGAGYTYKLLNVCSKKKAEGTRTKINLYVSSELGKFKWGDITQDLGVPAMKYRESESSEWTVGPFNRIAGFDYEKGYDYVLSVEKIVLPQNPSNYMLSVQYVLLSVVNKQKVMD